MKIKENKKIKREEIILKKIFCIFIIMFIIYTVLLSATDDINLSGNIELSESEEEWLSENHRFRIILNNYPPYMILHEDKIEGISID